MIAYFDCLISSLLNYRPLSEIVEKENVNYKEIQTKILPKIGSNITALEMISLIFSGYPQVDIRIDHKENNKNLEFDKD